MGTNACRKTRNITRHFLNCCHVLVYYNTRAFYTTNLKALSIYSPLHWIWIWTNVLLFAPLVLKCSSTSFFQHLTNEHLLFSGPKTVVAIRFIFEWTQRKFCTICQLAFCAALKVLHHIFPVFLTYPPGDCRVHSRHSH